VKPNRGEASAGSRLASDVAILDVPPAGRQRVECAATSGHSAGDLVHHAHVLRRRRSLFASIMAGSSGYVLKQVGGNSLIDDVRRVAAGESLLDRR